MQATNAGVLRCVWDVLGVRVSEGHGIHAPTPPCGCKERHLNTHWTTWQIPLETTTKDRPLSGHHPAGYKVQMLCVSLAVRYIYISSILPFHYHYNLSRYPKASFIILDSHRWARGTADTLSRRMEQERNGWIALGTQWGGLGGSESEDSQGEMSNLAIWGNPRVRLIQCELLKSTHCLIESSRPIPPAVGVRRMAWLSGNHPGAINAYCVSGRLDRQ